MPTSFISTLMSLFAVANALFALNMESYAAHGLELDAGEYAVHLYHTGAKYHMWHVFALLFTALLYDRWQDRLTRLLLGAAALCFAIAMVAFSGGMYRVPFGGGMTPVIAGAVLFLVGWGALGLGLVSGWWQTRRAARQA